MTEKKTEALKWIAKILNDNGISYRVGGGMATNLYGSGRPVNDIDISISGVSFLDIIPLVKDCISAGPKHYQNEKWDCVTLSLNYEGQDIDLTDADTLLMKKKDGSEWIKNREIYQKYPDVIKDVEGIKISLMDSRVLLEYKRELDGDHQKFDRDFLEKYINSETH